LSATDLTSENCRRPTSASIATCVALLPVCTIAELIADFLHPYHIPLMSKVVDLWHDQPDVTISVMRFLCECCHHTKSNRVYFDQSSSNGILLFWVIYDVVCAYGRQFIVGESNANLHGAWRVQDSYKGMSTRRQLLCLLWSILLIYNDPALENSFKMALQMTLGILWTHWDSLSQSFQDCQGGLWIWLSLTVNRVTQCFVSCVPIPLTTSLHFSLRSMERQARVGRVSISSTSIQKACLKKNLQISML